MLSIVVTSTKKKAPEKPSAGVRVALDERAVDGPADRDDSLHAVGSDEASKGRSVS